MSLFSPDDIVRLIDDVDKLKNHEKYHPFLLTCLGQRGIVKSINDDGNINVQFSGAEWCINPEAVTKIKTKGTVIRAKSEVDCDFDDSAVKGFGRSRTKSAGYPEGNYLTTDDEKSSQTGFTVGVLVKLDATPDKLMVIQRGHGDWQFDMQKAIGKVGVIEEVASNGDLKVSFAEGRWTLNPAACVVEKTPSAKAKPPAAKRLSGEIIDEQSRPGRNETEANITDSACSQISESENRCIICMERRVNIYFQCGHVTCDVCCVKVEKCHVCQQPITAKSNMYI